MEPRPREHSPPPALIAAGLAVLVLAVFWQVRHHQYLNLDDQDLLIYEKIFKIFEERVPQPELVIYLQASDNTLLERLEKGRGRRRIARG